MMKSNDEWLEADGLGGFASYTKAGTRTRKYHSLFLVSRKPPTDRRVLVNGVDAVVESGGDRLALTSQTYKPSAPGETSVVRYEGRPMSFEFDGSLWPTWKYDLGDGRTIEHSIMVPRGSPLVILSWRLSSRNGKPTRLVVRPFLSGRDYHSLQHENPAFNFKPATDERPGRWGFQPYAGEPGVVAVSNGAFKEEPYWYRGFLYTQERERGLEDTEDLGTPGTFVFDLESEAILVFGTDGATEGMSASSIEDRVSALRSTERSRRLAAPSLLARAASAYIADRGAGKTILAGYPWFTDWGRDTFISLRGLCIATGRLSEARQVLAQWSGAVSQGMLPNRFTDSDEAPEFNSVDASLWFIVAVHDLRAAEKRAGFVPSTVEEWQINAAIVAILRGYSTGTRHGIRMDQDHLLAAGEPGVQLTWMDAKVGDHVVTPRIGKPVEIQALWINALRIGGQTDSRFAEWAAAAEKSFNQKFWNESAHYLYDVVDADHVAGRLDGCIRPNALFAVGGLPYQLLHGDRARDVVALAEAKLLTPAGPRSLAPDDPNYRGTYQGGVWSRDTAYHQGTVWPYLMGAFVEAWVRSRERSPEALREARQRFLEPLITVLDPTRSGHLPEIAEGDAPHAPRGCPFQAWSVGEALRLDQIVLAPLG
ncbi:MAG: glycogen debranching enzyme family protein [Vicinamibacteria bacterium]|nr:glycogen debranching enzyme family protein [Vicinamibacteria bacterium]